MQVGIAKKSTKCTENYSTTIAIRSKLMHESLPTRFTNRLKFERIAYG